MKQKPALLGECRFCEKSKDDFEECLVLVEVDEVIVNCKDFYPFSDEEEHQVDYQAGIDPPA